MLFLTPDYELCVYNSLDLTSIKSWNEVGLHGCAKSTQTRKAEMKLTSRHASRVTSVFKYIVMNSMKEIGMSTRKFLSLVTIITLLRRRLIRPIRSLNLLSL